VKQATDALSQYESQLEDAEEQSKRKKTDLKSIQDEKESQAGGEVKSLIQQTDALSKKLVQENSRLSNLKDALQSENDQRNLLCKSMEELNEEAIKERIRSATEKRDEAAAEVERFVDKSSIYFRLVSVSPKFWNMYIYVGQSNQLQRLKVNSPEQKLEMVATPRIAVFRRDWMMQRIQSLR
jgi:DNA repair exonuclease SbcCD ATPase subunit